MMYEHFKADVERHKIPGHGMLRFMKQFSVPGCRFMIYWRLAKVYGGIFKLIVRRCSIKFGYQIPVATSIGGGLLYRSSWPDSYKCFFYYRGRL